MKEITLTIDGYAVTCKQGETILEASKKIKAIHIPTLCYSNKLKPHGVCRLCMVEITRGAKKKLVASCVYPAEEGLIVQTKTDTIVKMRRILIELLWPTSQQFAKEYGVTKSRFRLQQEDCNLCGLCVRYCSEINKSNIVYFKNRGIERKVDFIPGYANECASCEKCFDLCTGGWIINEMMKMGR